MRRGKRARGARIGGLSLLAACAAILVIALVPASPASASRAEKASVVHQSRYWSWTGPADWTASYGAYGITIQGPASGFSLGFSSTLCAGGATVQASAQHYFAQQRRILAKDARILGKSKIKTVPRAGANYFRQTVNIKNTIGGKLYFGQVVYDYQVTDPTYCYHRSISFGARANRYGPLMKQLLAVYGSLAYFGPGAYEGFF